MPKLKRKDIPAEVKEYLKDPSSFEHKSYWKSIAAQLKSKHWLSDKQVQIVSDHIEKIRNEENCPVIESCGTEKE